MRCGLAVDHGQCGLYKDEELAPANFQRGEESFVGRLTAAPVASA